jgi:alkylated DNA repair protein (DNA oxidative demethylase)
MSGTSGTTGDLFGELSSPEKRTEQLAEGAILLRGFVRDQAQELAVVLKEVVAVSPFRYMVVRGGHRMSVEMTNCGHLGWISDETGYRYDSIDPLTGHKWPSMPAAFRQLAASAAVEAGYAGFETDACLVNRYAPDARMGLHQDKNEHDYDAPIVSVSLGLPAIFLFGGMRRSDNTRRILLESGDVVVWGGPTRLAYHGVLKLADGEDPLTGRYRINLTFRKAG